MFESESVDCWPLAETVPQEIRISNVTILLPKSNLDVVEDVAAHRFKRFNEHVDGDGANVITVPEKRIKQLADDKWLSEKLAHVMSPLGLFATLLTFYFRS